MVIVLDCGNTALTFACYQTGERKAFFRTLTNKQKTVDEYMATFKSLFSSHDVMMIEAILISSVVPSLTPVLQAALFQITGVQPRVFSKGFKTGVPLKIDQPTELGVDLVADAVGALSQYKPPLVIADLGTATKFIGIDQSGSLIGVSISPGMMISLQALIGNAAQLMDISLKKPAKILGKNTADSMNSGMIYTTELMIKSMFHHIELEMGAPVLKILTGGYAHLIEQGMDDVIIDAYLNVDGLYQIYMKNKEIFS
jgi:type III pantothenate kinase